MPAFALTIFTGAFLLFLVQPLIGKFILPWFGGSPAVWTTCLLFFQVALLGGYAYAHLSARWLRPRFQVGVHLVLVAAALFFLPIIPGAGWKPSPDADPTWRILALLAVTIGLPYLVLSSTGPLMQQWFTLARPGVSPYRLYALSNVGSLLALVAYPFVVEPMLARQTQAVAWSVGMGIYAVFSVSCALQLFRATPRAAGGERAAEEITVAAPPAASQRLLWLCLPAAAAVLLMASTNKMCQDVAVIPFLWVLPLGLYLLSFILSFDSPQWYWRRFYGIALAIGMALLCVALFEKKMPLLPQIIIYCGALFVACMVCHGELYRLRPDPRYLTGFYLMIALGGALGGVFVALVAPLIFDGYFELHGGVVVLGLLLAWLHGREGGQWRLAGRSFPIWRIALAATVAAAIPLWIEAHTNRGIMVSKTRSFYGVLTVYEDQKDDPWLHSLLLQSGEITHGIQALHPTRRMTPVSYYSERSGLAKLMNTLTNESRRIGVIGLGTGSIAGFARAGDVVRFYEINPAVRHIAETNFTFLSGATGRVEIVMGDARLSMEREAPQQYDVLVLDAFSGDAIPVHLLTRESFEIYLRNLKTNGVIAAHISNRHLNLRPVMDNHAAQFGLASVFVIQDAANQPWYVLPSQWFLLSRDRAKIEHPDLRLVAAPTPEKPRKLPPWSDDHTSLLRVLK